MSVQSPYNNMGREKLFQFFKYTIYFLLFINIFYWLREDYLASAHTYRGGIVWQQIVDAFAQATDSVAWLTLLVVFELETSVISDEKLQSGWKWVLNAIAGVCYIFIVLVFHGYIEKLLLVYNFAPIPFTDGCDAVGQYLSYALDLDEYAGLTATNCVPLTGPLFANAEASIIATQDMHAQLMALAWAEVINAAAWVLVVLLLWVDVFFQLRGVEHGKLYRINVISKVILYTTLIAVCIYWGFKGDFMDFWDAFLWIVAFFFIELNIFKWAEEIETEKTEQKSLEL